MDKYTMADCNIGIIILEASNKEYICTSISMSFAMNSIPSADVVIGCGTLLANEVNKKTPPSAEDLLKTVLANKKGAYLSMLPCSIYEVIGTGKTAKKTKIFKGFIVSGAVMYKAGNPSIRSIRFSCMQEGCSLHACPLTAYVNMCSAAFIDYATKQKQFSAQYAQQEASTFWKNQINGEAICKSLGSEIDGKTLDKKVGTIINRIISASSYNKSTSKSTVIDLTNFLTSKTKQNGRYNTSCEASYNKMMCEYFMKQLSTSSVFDSIKAVLTSNAFMLNIIPEWKDSFKLNIKPSKAWTSYPAITQKAKNVIALNSNYNPIASLNTPNGFVVNFSDATQSIMDEVPADYIGANGVYSSNRDLYDVLHKRFVDGQNVALSEAKDMSGQQLVDPSQMLKAKIYNAPKWLHPAFADLTGMNNDKSVKDDKTCNNTTEAKNKTPRVINERKARELADEIAKCLFAHLYGSQDTAVLQLMPSLRFGYDTSIGCIESNIGNVIDVKLSDGAEHDSCQNIRGVITGFQYEYVAGEAGSVSYSINLGYMRPLDTSEKSIKNTLYDIGD